MKPETKQTILSSPDCSGNLLFRALLVNKKLKRKAGIRYPEKALAIRSKKKSATRVTDFIVLFQNFIYDSYKS